MESVATHRQEKDLSAVRQCVSMLVESVLEVPVPDIQGFSSEVRTTVSEVDEDDDGRSALQRWSGISGCREEKKIKIF